MQYHIDTTPIWEAFSTPKECPLCSIAAKLEESYVDRYLGGSVMDPDVRKQVNEKGFCKKHQQKLFQKENRLGLALMTSTRLAKVRSDFSRDDRHIRAAITGNKLPLKAAPDKALINALIKQLREQSISCLICEDMERNFKRYLETIILMFSNEKQLRDHIDEGQGLCMPHLADLLETALVKSPRKQRDELVRMLLKKQVENLERIQEELDWFTKKHDYQNADAPWGNSRNAPARSINKLYGEIVPE